MHLSSVLALFCSLYTALAMVPLSATIPGNDRVCYFVRAHRENAKIRVAFAVMTGGQFTIDAVLSRPDGNVAQTVQKSEGDDWLLSASQIGDYELCFSNDQSEEKVVQFEYSIDTNAIEASAPKPANDEHTYEMERYVNEIDHHASQISRQLQYLRSRNMRNEATVKSTASRIRWFTIIELVSMVAMAVFNVTIVQLFFKGSRRNVV